MPLFNSLKINDEEREEGTIGKETMSNIGNFVKGQYERIPEDTREGFEQGVVDAATGIQSWNKQLREDNYWGGIGPLDPFIGAANVYNAVATPIKKELSIKTGLAPSVIDTGEVGLDLLTPGIPLGAKKAQKIVNEVFDNIPSGKVYANLDNTPKFKQTELELKLEPFQSNTYQRSVLNKMNKYGMGDGTFRMKAYRAFLNKGDSGRDMLEAYLSPDRLRGSFEGYKKFNKKSVEYKWGAFLEKKGYDLSQGIQVHHINPLFDSIHLFDNVKFNSKEYWDLMDILIRNNARPGVIQKGDDINNLMMTLGQKADEATPHGIAHKFYNNFTPTFFSPAEMKKMNTVKGYRKKKAKRWATLVNKSEEVILEAHKQWSLLNPETAQNLSFDELVDRLSNLDAGGYNKLIDKKYQLPDMNSIIKEIAADKGLKGPIFKLQPKPVDLSSISKKEKTLLEAEEVFQQRQADAALRSMQKKKKPTDQIDLLNELFPDE